MSLDLLCSYLKISLSDFLTLFSARTSSFFWQRGLGRALGIAACVAMGTSTIFSLFWCGWWCPEIRPAVLWCLYHSCAFRYPLHQPGATSSRCPLTPWRPSASPTGP